MQFFLRLFDLFNETAKKLAEYLPQSGSDLINLFRGLGQFIYGLNAWITDNLGVNIRGILAPFGRLISIGASFLIDVVRQIVEKLQ
jgi:hypothetical protein